MGANSWLGKIKEQEATWHFGKYPYDMLINQPTPRWSLVLFIFKYVYSWLTSEREDKEGPLNRVEHQSAPCLHPGLWEGAPDKHLL